MLDSDVADDNAITLPPVPVQLKNVMFSGTGNGTGFEVAPGELGHSGSETID
ncbi:hypothetical protein D3C86_2166140 [compost metagenome]